MNSKCAVCKESTSAAGDGQFSCSSCKGKFHLICGGITEASFRKLGQERRAQQKCSECKETTNKTRAIEQAREVEPQARVEKSPTNGEQLILAELLEINKKLGKIDVLQDKISEMAEEIKVFKNINNMMNTKIEVLQNQLTEAEKRITEMDCRVRTLEKDTERKNRENNSNCLEFRGVPEYQDETPRMLKNIIFNISKTANYTIEADIFSIYRTGITQKNVNNTRPDDKGRKNRTLVVKFNAINDKEQLHNAIKKYNRLSESVEEKLNTSAIGLSGPRTPIYCSELLTFQAKRLWYLSRKLATESKYKYVWTKSGQIFIKKDDNSRPILVDSEHIITKLNTPTDKPNISDLA